MCHFDVMHAISSSYRLLSPASLRMAPQVAGGLRIALIREATDKMGSSMALNHSAFERVSFVVVNIFDCWGRFEEHINRCVPLLSQSY